MGWPECWEALGDSGTHGTGSGEGGGTVLNSFFKAKSRNNEIKRVVLTPRFRKAVIYGLGDRPSGWAGGKAVFGLEFWVYLHHHELVPARFICVSRGRGRKRRFGDSGRDRGQREERAGTARSVCGDTRECVR